jgi:hypothetical protein
MFLAPNIIASTFYYPTFYFYKLGNTVPNSSDVFNAGGTAFNTSSAGNGNCSVITLAAAGSAGQVNTVGGSPNTGLAVTNPLSGTATIWFCFNSTNQSLPGQIRQVVGGNPTTVSFSAIQSVSLTCLGGYTVTYSVMGVSLLASQSYNLYVN